MLRRVAGWLKPGGTLVYCVCSLQPEEGETLVEKMLPYLPLARAPIAAQDGVDPSWVTAAGDLRTLPHLGPQPGGIDGFYAARLVRPAN